ncbi:MAG TPA: aminotransferase class IV [Conexibacter sp.]|nr:aminotransferase class IV [Conexibacter sp.]
MDHALEPDPARGVFSTMLVVDGRPVELAPHLAQLRESVRALYAIELPDAAAELVQEEAHSFELARVRLACRAGEDGGLLLEALARAVERTVVLPDEGLDLRSAPVERWHGAHKWVDRRLLDRLEAAAGPASALLVARDERVLETTRANVFALGRDGVLRTPPTDGSILPGVTRAAVMALARERGLAVREEPLALAQLHDACEAFATGSIRGVESVRSLDGVPVGEGVRGTLTDALAEALRVRWLAPDAARVRAGHV